MRVKRLEVQGFKSFKDKTVIHFDHGITGIVGPNGCGKSNIVDAFFWVMGEQSYKHMRGSGSEDLIFNGSSKYTALGMAEATLVLENETVDTEKAPAGASAADAPLPSKKKEVSITRRVYRGGEGEYFMNGVPCRLRDIHEFFMDTGIGAKGYSVIEQGQIDKVVNAKPDDRRLLIEEAAGIAKYKARKKESLRKMEAAQSNLSRLTDVIQEIERNLNSLDRQAQKARKYKEYKDELFEKEITWGRRKAGVVKAQMSSIQKEREALEQDLVGLKAELQTVENTIEVDQIAQLTDSKSLEELQTSSSSLSSELTTERSALELSRHRQEDLRRQIESMQIEKTQLALSIEGDRASIQEKESELELMNTQTSSISTRTSAKDSEVREARESAILDRQALDGLKRELVEGFTQSTDLTSRSAALLARAESVQIQIQKLAEEKEFLAERVAKDSAESDLISVQAVESISRRDVLRETAKQEEIKVHGLKKEVIELEKAEQFSHKALTQLQSKLQSLKELAESHEGLADAPKAILDWAKEQGTDSEFKALADCFHVSQGYEHALEGWLEARLEGLVAQNGEHALSALDRIRLEKKGRATVQLAGLQPSADKAQFNASELEENLKKSGFEVLGSLNQFVKLTEGSPLSHWPGLDRVFVVQTLNASLLSALKGLLTLQQGWSIVTLEGFCVESSGLVRGGSTESDQTASILGRKRAIQELETQSAQAMTEFESIESRLQNSKASLHEAELNRARAQEELQLIEVQAATLERESHQLSRRVDELREEFENLKSELSGYEEESIKIQTDRSAIQEQLTQFIQKRGEVESTIQYKEGSLAEKESKLQVLDAELQLIKIEEASFRERSQSLSRELQSSRSFVADRERRLGEVTRLLERVSQEREQHSGGDQQVEQKIQELVHEINKVQSELSTVRDRVEQSQARMNSSLSRIKELHSLVEEKSTRANQLSIDLEKFHGELSHLVQNLQEKYGPECLEQPVAAPIQEEMADPVVTVEISAEEEKILFEEVETLRERIRRLGEVNTMAIEEFEEMKKRFDHLSAEKADLEKSIENLNEAIDHINKTSEERFRKAFDAIADRFEKLFPIVFGGGQARLSLVYPDGSNDILEAGVDILAQPPGKKIVNIGLLSGGEKALTAISLIFAIFMVKPSPFCLLDEVDAPLDDSNIGKFNALLREMAVKSQFIVITHNKKTMELNDSLYGVTMEEPGVSKMVSIELR